MPKPKGSVTFEYGIGTVGYQHCEACDTRWRYVWQKSRRLGRRASSAPSGQGPSSAGGKASSGAGRRSWLKPLLVCVVVAALVAGGVVLFQRNRKASYPATWDTRVAPIAAKVAAIRGLTFKHPVKVVYLSVPEFTKKVTASPEDLKQQGAEIAKASGMLRAGGLIGAKVNLAQAVNATQAADTVAFYDDDTKQIYVRGDGPFTVETRVTLAHELTHVLQDQYFDLAKITKAADASKSGSEDALTALVEGDATSVEQKYLAALTPAEQQRYAALAAKTAGTADASTKDLPAVVDTYFNAPYIFGPQVIRVLQAQGGNAAVNAAISGATPSTRIYLDPTAVSVTKTRPALPALQPGETKLPNLTNDDEQFDDFSLYLMLAARIDVPTALRAADAYSSGSEVLYKRGPTSCFRAAVVGDNERANEFLASVIRRWTTTVPDAAIDSGAAGAATPSAIIFHSCDPGARAVTPANDNITGATRLAANRDALVATLVDQHLTSLLAVCASRVLVDQPDVRAAILAGDTLANPSPQIIAESKSAGAACRQNPLAGLPN
jgi:hypothetical protein